jgi:hypothetical protein
MDFASCCFNDDSVFIFLPDLSLVFVFKNGSRLSFYVFSEEIRDSTGNFTVDYSYFLLQKKTWKKLRIVF